MRLNLVSNLIVQVDQSKQAGNSIDSINGFITLWNNGPKLGGIQKQM